MYKMHCKQVDKIKFIGGCEKRLDDVDFMIDFFSKLFPCPRNTRFESLFRIYCHTCLRIVDLL
jgi:hypothetical protein